LKALMSRKPGFTLIKKDAVALAIIIVVVLSAGVYYVSTQQKLSSLSGFGVEHIEIDSANSNSTIDGYVYVAATSSEQTQGFMGITSFGTCNGFAANESECIGMIFPVSSTQQICLWMHDTPIPLLQVWISQNGTVTTLYQAQPESDKSVCYAGMYVLETKPDLQITIGSRLTQSDT
jgi:uncharacterized membrane protein (UPF0127 family)